MLFDLKKIAEYKAEAPHTRYAKIIFDDKVISDTPMSMAYFRFEVGQVGPKHVHEKEVEVYFCTKGKGRVTIDEKEYILTEGSILYIPPKSYHETQNIGDGDFEFLAVFAPCLNMDNIRAWEM